MRFPRRAGILLHPTSLPGEYGIGDLGPDAYRWIDWLHGAGQRLWQLLPLGPTGYGDSPYQSFSAFAGNPMLLSPQRLIESGLLDPAALDDVPDFARERVDFGPVIAWKKQLLRRAFERFGQQPLPEACALWQDANAAWLEPYALFMALKEHFGGGPWWEWPEAIRAAQADATAHYRTVLAEEIAYHRFLQWSFAEQWNALHAYARSRDVAIIGDIPIFIAHDSVDAWANREMFSIHPDGTLEVQAGVPPDYFSETGQLWGNPLYRWDVMHEQGYAWWIERFRALFTLVDLVRLDHFRGFEAAWAVPGHHETAVHGEWRPGPGSALFQAVRAALGPLPIIAEDLGVITPEIVAMREEFSYPGMRILQFAFCADTSSDFLPHNYVQNCVAYTGTHDNETTAGWFDGLDGQTRERVLDYFDTSPAQLPRAMIRALAASVADTVVVPLQDVLELGNEARMNRPGEAGGNWQWRVRWKELTEEQGRWLAHIAALYGR